MSLPDRTSSGRAWFVVNPQYLGYHLSHIVYFLVSDYPEGIPFAQLTNTQPFIVLSRVQNHYTVTKWRQVVYLLDFRCDVGQFHAEHGNCFERCFKLNSFTPEDYLFIPVNQYERHLGLLF